MMDPHLFLSESAKLKKCLEISEISEPLTQNDHKKKLMLEACREMAHFQRENNPHIKLFYEKKNFQPEDLKEYSDLNKIPFIGVSAMKHSLVHTAPKECATLALTSSGTRGQKTHIWFDKHSLHRVQRMLDVYLEQEEMTSNEKTNYLVLNYDPEDAKDLGVAFTEKNQLRFAPENRSYYAVKKDKRGQWYFDNQKALNILIQYEKEKLPVRIFGMPAFVYEFLNFLGNRKFSFGSKSLILTGGGWKAAEENKISREAFRNKCSECFGIPKERIRDAFGMAEHSAPYFECKKHRFHVPVYNHLIIRDPRSLEALAAGKRGILELITPFNAIMPTLAILSTDWARIHKDPCECGWNTPTFSLEGRAGISKHKGCALHADDIVKRS